jgi:four helix bundle protein
MAKVSRFDELDCWKLASELCDACYRMTETGGSARDSKFRGQIRDSSASAPRNISEGFGRFYPTENAPFVNIAKASLEETQNHLLHGQRRRYWRQEDFDSAWKLSKRALGATLRYLQYLETCDGPVKPPRNTKPAPPRPQPAPRPPKQPAPVAPEPEPQPAPEPTEPEEPEEPEEPTEPEPRT